MDTRAYLLLVSEIMGVAGVTLLISLSKSFRNHPTLGFKYPRREAVVSLILFSSIFLAAIFIWPQKAGLAAVLPGLDSQLWLQLQMAGGALVLFVAVLAIRRQPLRSAGWNKPLLMPSLRYGMALILLSVFLRGVVFDIMRGLSQEIWLALLLWLGIALAEETIFRGYLQLRLSAYFNERIGWAVTALLFVLWQIPRWMLNPADFWLQLILGMVRSVLYGWMMQHTRHPVGIALYRAVSGWVGLIG